MRPTTRQVINKLIDNRINSAFNNTLDNGTITLKILPHGRLTGDRLADQAALRGVMNRAYFPPTAAAFDEILMAMSAEGYDVAFNGELTQGVTHDEQAIEDRS